jgi:hypothetical protein
MKPFEVKVTKTFTNDQIAGLLCTGFEGGDTASWAEIVKKVKPKTQADFEGDWLEYPLYSYPLGTGGQVVVKDKYTSQEHILDRKAIQRGLEIMAEKYPRHFNDFVDEQDDAITGDVFIQCCVLGDVIYG